MELIFSSPVYQVIPGFSIRFPFVLRTDGDEVAGEKGIFPLLLYRPSQIPF